MQWLPSRYVSIDLTRMDRVFPHSFEIGKLRQILQALSIGSLLALYSFSFRFHPHLNTIASDLTSLT